MFEDLQKEDRERFAEKLYRWREPLDLDLLRTAIADARGIPYTAYNAPETHEATLAYLLPLLKAGTLKAGRLITLKEGETPKPIAELAGTSMVEAYTGAAEAIIERVRTEWKEAARSKNTLTSFEMVEMLFTLPENPWPVHTASSEEFAELSKIGKKKRGRKTDGVTRSVHHA